MQTHIEIYLTYAHSRSNRQLYAFNGILISTGKAPTLSPVKVWEEHGREINTYKTRLRYNNSNKVWRYGWAIRHQIRILYTGCIPYFTLKHRCILGEGTKGGWPSFLQDFFMNILIFLMFFASNLWTKWFSPPDKWLDSPLHSRHVCDRGVVRIFWSGGKGERFWSFLP